MSASETCLFQPCGQKSVHYAYIRVLGEQTQFEIEITVNQSLFIFVSQASKVRDFHARMPMHASEAICFCPRSWPLSPSFPCS